MFSGLVIIEMYCVNFLGSQKFNVAVQLQRINGGSFHYAAVIFD